MWAPTPPASDTQTSTKWHCLKEIMTDRNAFQMDPRGNVIFKIGTEMEAANDVSKRSMNEDDAIEDDCDTDGVKSNAFTDDDDIGGDLRPSQEIRVCSKAMARASVVFRKMLFGCFAEAGRDGVISLPEDHVEPMFLALSIIHGHFAHVPYSLSIEELFELLVVTNKYDMTSILRPWLHTWLPRLSKIGRCPDKDLLAWIA